MPGRGRPWKEGGLNDDTVTGADIKAGTIELSDLSTSLQATAGSAGHEVQDEGTPLTQRAGLNFVGAGVTVTDDSGNDATVVTIPGGGSGSGDTVIASATPDGVNSVDLTFSETINYDGTVSEIYLVGSILLEVADTITIQINGDNPQLSLIKVDSVGVVTGVTGGGTSGESYSNTSPTTLRIHIHVPPSDVGNETNEIPIIFDETFGGSGTSIRGGGRVSTSFSGIPLTSITVFTAGLQNFEAGTIFTVYKKST